MASSKQTILPIFTVDAFAKQAFSGNGAAVCLVDFEQVVPYDIKQKIAAEMKLSETAFISTKERNSTFEKGNRFTLQWFTPECEVPLCGHATLAAAAILFFACKNPSPCLEFETVSGLLKAKKSREKIEIDLPAYDCKPADSQIYEDIVKGAVGSLPTEEVVVSAESGNLLVRLKDSVSRQEFLEMKPRDDVLLPLVSNVTGLIVTLKGSDDFRDMEGNQYDFVSRYFAPWVGISEDPVTGSAHSVLAPFWSKILNKNDFYARQCSKRGGDLNVRLMGDRVAISGDTTIMIRGQIRF